MYRTNTDMKIMRFEFFAFNLFGNTQAKIDHRNTNMREKKKKNNNNKAN